jgi:hypothetical protein
VHNHLRTHESEGATEPGRNGPWPVGPRRSAQPTPGVGSPPFPCTRRIFNPKTLEAPPFARGSHSHQEAIHKLEREEGDLRRGIDHLEGSTHKWRRRKTPSRVTMINGAMSSTLMGNLLIRPWVVIDLEM